MRWKESIEESPNDGETYIVEAFLWLPLTINNETRWLEHAKYKIKYYKFPYPELSYGYRGGWEKIEWINEQQNER